MNPTAHIKLEGNPLDIAELTAAIRSTKNGGECVFIGTVRDNHQGKVVTHLEFEAYEPMAIRELTRIADLASAQFKLAEVLIHHRIGTVYPGEAAIVIVVTAPHRNQLFDACKMIIDQLKETVPIWKKEVYTDGASWVQAHP
ncbi:MAG: molybdenum cofactor biosynthesis protein MoaE [Flavobacteriales bacterium]|nr:molybdenum cofactor biosynthesis protein MoaE [Bacteroidota bacterium]MCB9240783.1 molybdenum cofactor biosynthesis protein MoaE [Flavobacteriales bacterium]